ncbi:class I SAM-dependent methyltransferase [Piscinibacter gummiphilus]|uniref:class I SAM-dependent methyltransferase n=1 Tax=Piscinibacter gummiphilus TaxID=946333 RepID=UPI000A26DF6A|nr:class I SAM-dependent methyltransferase [Piscinibacter gummiphilus]ATU67336.1 class I SAM-dependent methyltransferase [Piscinibacter gummiphilus]GLS97681.1 hypothetical protein GCM10007918_49730 [Piscinibacter gummiphilus]
MTGRDHDTCRVCGGRSLFTYSQRVLDDDVRYFDCAACGYFQTEKPYWLEKAYASAINDVDTGILWRNQLNVRRVLMTLSAFGKLSGVVVDHAGGYGILVRLLRDVGVDARWRDKYCANLLARGFEADGTRCDLLTAFEVFEHLEYPLAELESLLAQAPVVLLSTDLIRQTAPPAPDWWYLGQEHGQHIGFFRERTLAGMAKKLGCHHASDGRSLHVFSHEPIPRRWLPMQRLNRLAPLVTAGALRSRVQSDFEALRRSGAPLPPP